MIISRTLKLLSTIQVPNKKLILRITVNWQPIEMSENEADQAFQNFKELRGRVDQAFSESDTRAKIIDPVFINCWVGLKKTYEEKPIFTKTIWTTYSA